MESPIQSVYSEELEPVATEEEIASYERQVEAEEEEEEMLRNRFSKVVRLDDWCSCGHCSLDLVIKQEECFCCRDIDRCSEKLEEIELEVACISEHPGFNSVCLDTWVLDAAAIGLKTRKGRSYTVMKREEQASQSQFYRAVAYRQFYRFIWEFGGNSRRLPLPCCVYGAIRARFSSEDGIYRGFIEEENENEESESESEEEEEDEEEEVHTT